MAEIREIGNRAEHGLLSGDGVAAGCANAEGEAIAGDRDAGVAAVEVDDRDRQGDLQIAVHIRPEAAGGERQQCAGVGRMLGMGADRRPRTLGHESGIDGVDHFVRTDGNGLAGQNQEGAFFEERPIVEVAAERSAVRTPAGDFKFFEQRREGRQLCILAAGGRGGGECCWQRFGFRRYDFTGGRAFYLQGTHTAGMGTQAMGRSAGCSEVVRGELVDDRGAAHVRNPKVTCSYLCRRFHCRSRFLE